MTTLTIMKHPGADDPLIGTNLALVVFFSEQNTSVPSSSSWLWPQIVYRNVSNHPDPRVLRLLPSLCGET